MIWRIFSDLTSIYSHLNEWTNDRVVILVLHLGSTLLRSSHSSSPHHTTDRSFQIHIDMAPPAGTTTNQSTKSTGEGHAPTENGLANDKNQQVVLSPLQKIEKVVVHPLVLLSVVDHFNRMGKIGNSQRVVGVLLGSLKNKILDISNSFACETDRIEFDSFSWSVLFQCHSMKKIKRKMFGFLIMNIWRICIPCFEK